MRENREWKKYHNRQKYSECQLVTALNIYYYLTGKWTNQESKRYENLIDLCGARHGSAVQIEKVWKRLKIEPKQFFRHTYELLEWQEEKSNVGFPLPLEVSIWHKRSGFHSAAIVDYEMRTECVRILNFRHETSTTGWLFLEDLYKFLVNNPNLDKPRYKFRLFGLVNNSLRGEK